MCIYYDSPIEHSHRPLFSFSFFPTYCNYWILSGDNHSLPIHPISIGCWIERGVPKICAQSFPQHPRTFRPRASLRTRRKARQPGDGGGFFRQSVRSLPIVGSSGARSRLVHRVLHRFCGQLPANVAAKRRCLRAPVPVNSAVNRWHFRASALHHRAGWGGVDNMVSGADSPAPRPHRSSHPRPAPVRASSMNSSMVNVSGRARGSMPAASIAASSHRPRSALRSVLRRFVKHDLTTASNRARCA